MSETHTQEEFRAWFDLAFAASDLNGDGNFDKAEAEAFARGVHSLR